MDKHCSVLKYAEYVNHTKHCLPVPYILHSLVHDKVVPVKVGTAKIMDCQEDNSFSLLLQISLDIAGDRTTLLNINNVVL